MRRTITTATMALAMVAMLAVVADGAPRPPRPRPEPPAMDTGGNFASICRFSHRLPDDPIVAPGAPGASHSHDFFGNTTTDANSTYASLQAGDTTCNREADTAAYWVPTLSSGGRQIRPLGVQAYYNARGKEGVEPPPADLRIIAGDGHAQAPQPIAIVAWHCGERMREGLSQTPPSCEDGRLLRLQIRFPDCWDGANLDSADHKSHMAYSRRATCPSTHPVPLAGLRLTVTYPISDGIGATLSSGGVLTGHADFFNAWDQDELARLTEFCLNGHHACGRRG
ncbi:MAG TPA: DUF1996 domain-containing protein [Actinomycetota bacterium]